MIKLIISTTTKESAETISRKLIEARLAACINIILSVKSFFYWENQIVAEEEAILFIKTNDETYDHLITLLRNLHPYSIPEIMTIDSDQINVDYLEWMNNFLASRKKMASENFEAEI